MSDNATTRRRFLRVAGGTTALALAGCSGNSDGGNSDETTDDGSIRTGSMTETDSMGTESMDTESMDDSDSMANESMNEGMQPSDPAEASRATIDRFSEAAGNLHVRGPDNDLPGPNEPVDFDAIFLTRGLGPDGGVVQYYDFDVQSTMLAPIYALFYENGDPVEGQLNIVDVIPGDEGYNDFWHVHRVTVPDEYDPNTITSASALDEAGYEVEPTGVIKNCPVVPEGSTASMRLDGGSPDLVDGWYEGQVVSYFLFEEASIETTGNGRVPVSPIYVSFNTNPGQEGGGPTSGFMTEEGSDQTHNVVATVPDDTGYSPMWTVNIYDNAEFDSVSDLESATDVNILASGAAMVNCPIVSVA
ncbi:MAG: hypothetical protein ABEH65_09460 [Halobacteriales archaeon]